MVPQRQKRSSRLLDVLDKYDDVTVVMHNNPDPDAIATGWALVLLVEGQLHKPARLLGRGPILRAENVQLLELLQPPVELVDSMRLEEQTATVLVDCSPASANHLLGGCKAPVAVIDHHASRGDGFRIPFRDQRPNVTASASIATDYMREQGVEPPPPVATALLYAIRTEMIGARKALSRVDHSALRWLSAFVDYDALFQIENPPLPFYYYEELLLALGNVLVYAESAICFLPRVTAPEIVAEVADLLMRCDALRYVLCVARVGDDFLLSARSKGEEPTALTLLSHVLRELGHFGGHFHRAGGKVSIQTARMKPDRIEQKIHTRWLEACGTTARRGQRLVGRKQILRRK